MTTIAGYDVSFPVIDGPAASATFFIPTGLALDANKDIYIADSYARKVRKLSNGFVSTFAGTSGLGNLDGPTQTCTFYDPHDIVIDSKGNIFILEMAAHKIRKISGGIISSFAGSTAPGYTDSTGINAQFYYPEGICIDKSDNIFVADLEYSKIRKVTPEGIVKTYAGKGEGSQDGPISIASFKGPVAVAIDSMGNVYVADQKNYKVRKIEVH